MSSSLRVHQYCAGGAPGGNTRSGGSYEWHQDPVPCFVITLSGTLEFKTKSGATFIIRPGDVLLAQDNSGTGHKWRLIGDDPWRRAYVVYDNDTDLGFKPASAGYQIRTRVAGPSHRWSVASTSNAA
jgi:uncharacterized cupin superfamily protein